MLLGKSLTFPLNGVGSLSFAVPVDTTLAEVVMAGNQSTPGILVVTLTLGSSVVWDSVPFNLSLAQFARIPVWHVCDRSSIVFDFVGGDVGTFLSVWIAVHKKESSAAGSVPTRKGS